MGRHGNIPDLAGKRFGKLAVIELVGTENGHALWRCRCDCGNEKITRTVLLTQGKVKSCGCLHNEALIERSRTHGESATPLYRVWATMRGRCMNPNHTSYKNYGARGISVCNEWDEYESFRDWANSNGYKKGLAIDRIDSNGNYTPENCRWITQAENNRNKRKMHVLTANGETHLLIDWAKITGTPRTTLYNRARLGWSDEEIVYGKRNDN